MDDNDKLIPNSLIEEVNMYLNGTHLMSWYSNGMLNHEDFTMENLIPISNKNLMVAFNIKSNTLISSIYLYAVYEKYSLLPLHIKHTLSDFYYKPLYQGNLVNLNNNRITVELSNNKYQIAGYYGELRFALIDPLTKQRVNKQLIKSVSISNILDPTPVSLLDDGYGDNDGLLIYNPVKDIVSYKHLTNGIIIKDNHQVIIEFIKSLNNTLNDLDHYVLEIYGKKMVDNIITYHY